MAAKDLAIADGTWSDSWVSWDREDPWVKKELQEGARLDFLPAG